MGYNVSFHRVFKIALLLLLFLVPTSVAMAGESANSSLSISNIFTSQTDQFMSHKSMFAAIKSLSPAKNILLQNHPTAPSSDLETSMPSEERSFDRMTKSSKEFITKETTTTTTSSTDLDKSLKDLNNFNLLSSKDFMSDDETVNEEPINNSTNLSLSSLKTQSSTSSYELFSYSSKSKDTSASTKHSYISSNEYPEELNTSSNELSISSERHSFSSKNVTQKAIPSSLLETTSSRHNGSVPLLMLNMFESLQKFGDELDFGSDTVRSFLPLSIDSPEESERKSFTFGVAISRGEHVRTLLLRIRVLVEKDDSPIGLQRRLEVFLTGRGGETLNMASEDLYLHHNSWVSLDISAMKNMVLPSKNRNLTLTISVSNIFSSVGAPGRLDIDSTDHVDLKPLLLMYSRHNDRENAPPVRPLSRKKRSSTKEYWEDPPDDHFTPSTVPPPEAEVRKGRRRGNRWRKRRARNMCRRRPLRVDFKSIGWSDWVIAPIKYKAYRCSGRCLYPLASHLTPTKHAIIQTLLHSRTHGEVKRPCCVPTRLGPISLLYLDDGIPTLKKEYGGMVALECGCR